MAIVVQNNLDPYALAGLAYMANQPQPAPSPFSGQLSAIQNQLLNRSLENVLAGPAQAQPIETPDYLGQYLQQFQQPAPAPVPQQEPQSLLDPKLVQESADYYRNLNEQRGPSMTPLLQQMLAGQRDGVQAQQRQQELAARMEMERQKALSDGLKNGVLRYTPEQQTQMKQLQTAMQKLQTNPEFSHAERMNGLAQLDQQYRMIRDNPMDVPYDEQPLSPEEEFWKSAAVIENPITGQQMLVTKNRTSWDTIEDKSKQAEQQAALDQQKFDHTVQQSQLEQQAAEGEVYREATAGQMRLQIETQKMLLGLQQQIFAQKAKIAELKATAAEGEKTIDTTEAEQYLAQMQQFADTLQSQLAPPAQSMPAAPAPATPGITSSPPPASQTPAPPPEQTADDSMIIGPNAAGRYARKHSDGRVELLPEGFAP